MGVTFAFKHNHKTYLAIDSIYFGLLDEVSLYSVQNFLAWKVRGVDDVYMAYQGRSRRVADLLKVKNDLIDPKMVVDGTINLDYVGKELIPSMYDLVESNKIIDPDDKPGHLTGDFLLVTPSQILLIDHSGYILEQEAFIATGDAEQLAYGAYKSLPAETKPLTYAIDTMLAIEKHARTVHFPMLFIDVNRSEMTVIKKTTSFQRHKN